MMKVNSVMKTGPSNQHCYYAQGREHEDTARLQQLCNSKEKQLKTNLHVYTLVMHSLELACSLAMALK